MREEFYGCISLAFSFGFLFLDLSFIYLLKSSQARTEWRRHTHTTFITFTFSAFMGTKDTDIRRESYKKLCVCEILQSRKPPSTKNEDDRTKNWEKERWESEGIFENPRTFVSKRKRTKCPSSPSSFLIYRDLRKREKSTKDWKGRHRKERKRERKSNMRDVGDEVERGERALHVVIHEKKRRRQSLFAQWFIHFKNPWSFCFSLSPCSLFLFILIPFFFFYLFSLYFQVDLGEGSVNTHAIRERKRGRADTQNE